MTNTPGARRTAQRRGLSTLEMVLCLPILLSLMALMVNFGTFAAWKVRCLTVARHEAWANRWPRSEGIFPKPWVHVAAVPDHLRDPEPRWVSWPGSRGVGGTSNIEELDDSRMNHPVARGQLPRGAIVNNNLLNPARGARRGTASLSREWPMLSSLGQFHTRAQCPLLDDAWQFSRMGLSHNVDRRIPVLYELDKADPALVTAYMNAVHAILENPDLPVLQILDNDPEWQYYHRMFPPHPMYGWYIGEAPDFHPGMDRFCSLDHEVAQERVDRLVEDRIPNVARKVARAFKNMYQRVLNRLLNPWDGDAPPSPGEIAALQKKIQLMEQWENALDAP